MDFLFPLSVKVIQVIFFTLQIQCSNCTLKGNKKNYYKENLKKIINGKAEFAYITGGVVYLILDKITIKLV